MKNEIESKTVVITPEYALELLQKNARNRPLNKNKVIFYCSQMTKGNWKENGEPIIFSDGNTLLDGKHRLAAIVKSGITQKMLVVTNVDVNYFDTIDTGKIRSASDILSILDIKNATSISATITSYESIRNGYMTRNNSKRDLLLSKSDVLKIYNSNPEYWQDLHHTIANLYQNLRLMQRSILGAYITYLIIDKKHDREKVVSFFSQLFLGKNIENETISILREKLIKSISGQYQLTLKYRHAILAKTWNCFIKGIEIKQLHFNIEKDDLPEFL